MKNYANAVVTVEEIKHPTHGLLCLGGIQLQYNVYRYW